MTGQHWLGGTVLLLRRVAHTGTGDFVWPHMDCLRTRKAIAWHPHRARLSLKATPKPKGTHQICLVVIVIIGAWCNKHGIESGLAACRDVLDFLNTQGMDVIIGSMICSLRDKRQVIDHSSLRGQLSTILRLPSLPSLSPLLPLHCYHHHHRPSLADCFSPITTIVPTFRHQNYALEGSITDFPSFCTRI